MLLLSVVIHFLVSTHIITIILIKIAYVANILLMYFKIAFAYSIKLREYWMDPDGNNYCKLLNFVLKK